MGLVIYRNRPIHRKQAMAGFGNLVFLFFARQESRVPVLGNQRHSPDLGVGARGVTMM